MLRRIILSCYEKIAKTSNISIMPIFKPNPQLNRIINPNMKSQPQVDFLKVSIPNKIDKNLSVDSSYVNRSGDGAIHVPDTKDFYMGEPL